MNTGRSEKHLIDSNFSPIDDPRIKQGKFQQQRRPSERQNIAQLRDLDISDIQDDMSKKPSVFPDDNLSDYF